MNLHKELMAQFPEGVNLITVGETMLERGFHPTTTKDFIEVTNSGGESIGRIYANRAYVDVNNTSYDLEYSQSEDVYWALGRFFCSRFNPYKSYKEQWDNADRDDRSYVLSYLYDWGLIPFELGGRRWNKATFDEIDAEIQKTLDRYHKVG